MAATVDDLSPAAQSQSRLGELLDNLSCQGLTQQQIAAQAGLPAQYLSDIKRGRRPMTELVARRLGEQFDVNHQWLLGTSPSMARPRGQANPPGGTAIWLPLFPHPIEGEPRENPDWSGTGLEISGAAASKLTLARQPYILRFGHDDPRGRLRKGDFVLISQTPSEVAEISVVAHRKKLFLARGADGGPWERVAKGSQLPADCPIKGHCMGIVWSSLCAGFD